MKKVPTPPPPAGVQGRPPKPHPETGKPPGNPRQPGSAGASATVRALPLREASKVPNARTERRKERQEPPAHRWVFWLVSPEPFNRSTLGSREEASAQAAGRKQEKLHGSSVWLRHL